MSINLGTIYVSASTTTTSQQSQSSSQQRSVVANEQPLPITVLPCSYYQSLFAASFTHFNQIQSSLYENLVNDDKTLVIHLPTGSGKSVLYELAIIREMIKLEQVKPKIDLSSSISSTSTVTKQNFQSFADLHILYLAPLKTIVEEKCVDWQRKFCHFGLRCFALTSETNLDSLHKLNFQQINILLTTPDMLDYTIRMNRRSIRQLLCMLQLVLIDDVHMLADKTRGDVLEAAITLIKTLRTIETQKLGLPGNQLRFIAISATISNVSDIATWLDSNNSLGILISPEMRPVKLNKLVLGYTSNRATKLSEYRFDIQLNIAVEQVIRQYAEHKPVLVFCATRKSVELTAKSLATSMLTYYRSDRQQEQLHLKFTRLMEANNCDPANCLKNQVLRHCIQSGVAFYHSGLESTDRWLIEQLFLRSLLPVLVSTSSLAMSVNLSAHLVIVKNTVQYINGATVEYDISHISQMMERAGRPKFDLTAKVIIMTRMEKKHHYEAVFIENFEIESCLHLNMSGHLLMEIALGTITNISLAIQWLRSTFFFIRIVSNPSYYGINIKKGDYQAALLYLFDWTWKMVGRIERLGLILIKPPSSATNNTFALAPTPLLRIVTQYKLLLNSTEKLLSMLTESWSLDQLIVCYCCSFAEIQQDIVVRQIEKRYLNELNKRTRFRIHDRIRTPNAKICTILQAYFTSLEMESCLINDGNRIMQAGSGVSQCFVDMFMYAFNLACQSPNAHILKAFNSKCVTLEAHFGTILSALQLQKAFRTRLWHDSPYVWKQLPKISTVMCKKLVNCGYNRFDQFLDLNPKEIESIFDRQPPFGHSMIQSIKTLPKYLLTLQKIVSNTKNVRHKFPISLDKVFGENHELIQSIVQININLCITTLGGSSGRPLLPSNSHHVMVIIGCKQCDQLIMLKRFTDQTLISAGTFMVQLFTLQCSLELNDGGEHKPEFIELVNQLNVASAANFNNYPQKQQQNATTTEKQQTTEDDEQVSNIVWHCCYANHTRHTIEACVISEHFVGIDVMGSILVDWNRDDDNNKGQQSNRMCSRTTSSSLSSATQPSLVEGTDCVEKPFFEPSSSLNISSNLLSMLADENDFPMEPLDDLCFKYRSDVTATDDGQDILHPAKLCSMSHISCERSNSTNLSDLLLLSDTGSTTESTSTTKIATLLPPVLKPIGPDIMKHQAMEKKKKKKKCKKSQSIDSDIGDWEEVKQKQQQQNNNFSQQLCSKKAISKWDKMKIIDEQSDNNNNNIPPIINDLCTIIEQFKSSKHRPINQTLPTIREQQELIDTIYGTLQANVAATATTTTPTETTTSQQLTENLNSLQIIENNGQIDHHQFDHHNHHHNLYLLNSFESLIERLYLYERI